ncbi:glycosyltransferase [Leptolyngbya sp. FACHB-17]|uniref:glycosyltransferase n=1 Tax=unclassified Leptolyngbya TaxID=2650499 RepID=UPI0016812D47|nr:glycosyltransferase [Leptolyngbya sp. FACHB-17]MBD2079178.1 glycosyltransferase family 4 protein [Leptolyngbya sp. FACHB-17]
MKLLIVNHSCTVSVVQQFYAEIEQQTGWELTIVMPENWKDEYGIRRKIERWKDFRGQIISIPVWRSGSIPLHSYRSFFVNLLRKLNPDFIYLHQEPYALVTLQVYLANYFTIRKPISFFTWQNILKRYPIPFRQMERWILKHTDVMFPGSYSAEAVMREKGYTGQSVLMPSGIDPAIYYPRSNTLKTELGAQDVLIGYVGRIVEQKGLKTLLLALNEIRSRPWRLVMIGSGEYESEFDAIAQQLNLSDRIQKLGFVPFTETPNYLSAFDLLVLPSETRSSWKEQFGRVIIEAMACGTPVIGSDSGEIPHLISATKGGLVFPEGNAIALSQKLSELILNPELRSHYATTGRQAVLNHYTNSLLAQRFAETVKNTVQFDPRSQRSRVQSFPSL